MNPFARGVQSLKRWAAVPRGSLTRHPAHPRHAHPREIHIHASPPSAVATKTAPGLLGSQIRNILAQILPIPAPIRSFVPVARSLHSSRLAHPTASLSFPARASLRGPTLFIPRGPAVVSRSTAQVGLGHARTFCSSRPLFQNLVQNVPIAGRAMWEADWELNIKKDMGRKRILASQTEEKKARGEMLKPRTKIETASTQLSSDADIEADLEHYFPTPKSFATTYLIVPLAPFSRTPLPYGSESLVSSDEHPLLPIVTMARLHSDHTVHSYRVNSLFRRLDQAAVWDRGVRCEAYGYNQYYDDEGAAQYVKVVFSGWTKEDVKAVVGTAGEGWCEIRATHHQFHDRDDDSVSSDTDSVPSSPPSPALLPSVVELSLALPTLDFSASFLSQLNSSELMLFSSAGPSDLEYDSDTESDVSDEYTSDVNWAESY